MHQKKIYFYLLVLLATPLCTHAANDCPEKLATVISFQGKVDTQNPNEYSWEPMTQDYIFCYGDKIRTSKNSRATLKFKNETRVTLDQNSTLTFATTNEKGSSWFNQLIQGAAFFRSRKTQKTNVQTPFINAVHEGTEYLVKVTAHQTLISVFDGRVVASNAKGKIRIEKGYSGIAGKNQAPRIQMLTIHPEDAVQWSLYYPAIIDYGKFDSSDDASLQSSINANLANNPYQALILMNAIPASQQDADYLTLKSSLLLMFGSVEEAIKRIDQALVLESDNSTAIALKSIVAVTKNRQDKALKLAKNAVKHDPKAAVAQIALSYAYQSKFDIESALKASKEAVRLSPNNALAWARLSELQLSTGERSDALKSAEQATVLNPKLGRTQTILGYANLAQVDVDEAKTAFNQAINLDSADPLAHLGLGLAKIRKGDIEGGTGDIETAVSLDPDNAIMRSYLGKAYYELKNDDYAATELSIAKEKDPKDPTPWFYDAIRKQTTNRPVEALHDMQKAIELNDNRGVYRSKLLLDEDTAARSANMARIYQDLDFDRIALKQAWISLGLDYTNPSAHRFLSDTLQGRPRQRIARASELLQAQLFQPINTVPVQPQLTSENIGILNSTGPGSLSSNEYDPLFTSNGAHILLNGAYGSNNTLTDSAIITGLYDQFSVSFGQFHFQTDGFRDNDDYEQDIYDVFAQFAINPDLNIQIELKSEDVRAGDLPLRLNGFHNSNLKQSIEQDTVRLGNYYKINPENDFITSFFYTTRKDVISDTSDEFLGQITESLLTTSVEGNQTEIQHIYHPSSFQLITGMGYLNQKTKGLNNSINIFVDPPIEPDPLSHVATKTQLQTDYFNAYVYLKNQFFPNLATVLGLSFDSFNSDIIDRQQLSTTCNPFIANCNTFRTEPIDRVQFNPKFGVTWFPVKELSFRSAIFRTLNRPLTNNQTIEPTQVAGFNQFFDGNNGATAWQYAIGLDYNPIKTLYAGGEAIWRNSKQPVSTTDTQQQSITKLQRRNESLYLAYLYWVPTEWTSLKIEYRHEQIKRDFENGKADQTNPRSVTTHQVPISINLYHPSGSFAKMSGTYVNQRVDSVIDSDTTGFDSNFPLNSQGEDFWTFDATLGYRFPNRYGVLSFEARNLFNNKFGYQSTFDASGPQLTSFVPERQLFVKLSLFY